jgi:hypothetical protein
VNWDEVFQVNPRPKRTVENIGRGKHRVVIIDDYYKNPEKVVALARSLCYVQGGGGSFPGTRAVVSVDTRPQIANISEHWGCRLESVEPFHPVVFAAIVHDGARLNVAQRQPHIDPGITGLFYLNTPEQCVGGTALYRHKLTGIERIPLAPTAEIAQLAMKCDVNPEFLKNPQGYTTFQDNIIFNPLFAAPEGEYINDGNDYWEKLFLVEMKFNRLVIVDGRVPHSQYIKTGQFKSEPRITQTFYLRA